MAIDRTGISSLDAGASDITYSGNEGPKSPDQQLMAQADPMLVEMYQQYVFEMEEQGMQPISFKEFMQQAMSGMAYGGSANPTYTQKRKQSLAYGGIAGLDGRKKYGIGSWFQENIKDPIAKLIPNEIKDNPVLSAAVLGGAVNQWGLPDWLIPDSIAGSSNADIGKNWIGNLLSKVPGTGEGTIDMVLGGERGADQIGLGEGIRNIGASLGIVPQEVNLDPFFNPRRLLELQAGMYGVKKADRITDEILKLVSLENNADSYARSLSGGMKRRLLIAKALVHKPPILILDEPTAGVDVELRKNLWDNVKLLNNIGVTIILTTHYLIEAEQMCDRIGILNQGNIVALDTTKNLLNKIQTKIVTFTISEKTKIDNIPLNSLKIISQNENQITVSYEKNSLKIDEIISHFLKKNINILDISTDDADIEDVYTNLTKN